MEKKRVLFRTGNAVMEGDLAFIDGHPHVVWQWDGDQPVVTTRLDPARLQTDPVHLPRGVDAVYGQELADPRKAH